MENALDQIYVSLTTIKARIGAAHHVVQSLLAQDFERGQFKVTLYLSRDAYLLDEGCPELTPELESLARDFAGSFEIRYVPNTGPYRKIFPALDRIYALPHAQFTRALVVTADDDTIYPPHWLGGLYAAYRQHQCVIGYRGRGLVVREGQIAPYREWSKTVLDNPSVRTVLTGKDGIMYSPLHLHPRVRDEHTALRVAPKADDLWLKAHSLLLGVPAYAVHDSLAHEFPSVTPAADTVSLYHAFNRRGGNDEAVSSIARHFAQSFGVSLGELVSEMTTIVGRVGLVI